MRKATTLAWSVLIVSLAMLTTVLALRLYYHTTPSTLVTVRVTSDPPGATLSTLDQASVLGATPLTMRYALPEQWRTCVSYDGLNAKWPNGVQIEVRTIELCPEGGTDQEIRLAAPMRQQARRTRASQPNQAGPLSDPLTPMDLSLPEPAASQSDALRPMDLSVPEPAASRSDALTPMDLSVPDSAPPPSTAPAKVITTRKTDLFVAPAAGTEALDVFGPGAVFTVIGTEGAWYLVTYEHLGGGQRKGYIQQRDVRRLAP